MSHSVTPLNPTVGFKTDYETSIHQNITGPLSIEFPSGMVPLSISVCKLTSGTEVVTQESTTCARVNATHISVSFNSAFDSVVIGPILNANNNSLIKVTVGSSSFSDPILLSPAGTANSTLS